LADPDSDGRSNAWEYFLGSDPQRADADTPPGLSIAQLTSSEDVIVVRGQYRRRADLSDLSVFVESSNDLLSWTSDGVSEQAGLLDPFGMQTIEAEESYPATPAVRAFLRLRWQQ
jgi:hypothetical protein